MHIQGVTERLDKKKKVLLKRMTKIVKIICLVNSLRNIFMLDPACMMVFYRYLTCNHYTFKKEINKLIRYLLNSFKCIFKNIFGSSINLFNCLFRVF